MCLIIVDYGKSSIPITVIVKGIAISGNLINEVAYLNGIAGSLKSIIDDEISKKIGTRIEESIASMEMAERIGQVKTGSERRDLFLSDPKIWTSPKSYIKNDSGFIALRTDSIDGFMLGTPSAGI